MIVAVGQERPLGSRTDPWLRFGDDTDVHAQPARKRWFGRRGGNPRRAPFGRRLLLVADQPAFELSHWCGTSAFLFERLEGATKEGRDHALRGWLARGLDDLDDDVIEQVAPALPYGDYLPMLLEVIPRLTLPGRSDDYFSHESVATWGIDGFWGLPWYPHTPYYRTFETKIDSEAHLYEFVVPMVPSTWNDAERVAEYEEILSVDSSPTALAVSILEICQPAILLGSDYYAHWSLTHFLLDGHHKMEAAARTGRPLRLLTLVSMDEGLATRDQVLRVPEFRSRPGSVRGA